MHPERNPHRAFATDLAGIYADAAARDITERNPIVFIPGILGSKLVDTDSEKSVWGDFGSSYADPAQSENRRLIALPMQCGLPLDELASTTEADGALGEARLRRLPFMVGAYRDILQSVGIGSVKSGTRHRPDFAGAGTFASFEFGYDWRRSLDEAARKLGEFLRLATFFVQAARGNAEPVKFDIVAHSMGGLVLRYYLRYGMQRLAHDGTLPRLTWAGSERVSRAVIIGTPNAGSAFAIERLVTGLPARSLIHPGFDPFIVGTMPALYQLLPRTRHGAFVDENNQPVGDLLDAEFWTSMGWGLAADHGDKLLAPQLTGVDSPDERRTIALDHLAKCLLNAKTFHAAMDLPAIPPSSLEVHLIAGDAHLTPEKVTGTAGDPHIRVVQKSAGDGIVLRSSALLDERAGGTRDARVITPIRWKSVMFAEANHIGLTRDRVVVDNVLFRLLEDPLHAETAPAPSEPIATAGPSTLPK